MEIKELKEQLFKRLNYDLSTPEKEKLYDKERNKIEENYPNEGWRIPQGYLDAINQLNNKKLTEIRKSLNDDNNFEKLKEQLSNIQYNIEKKKTDLHKEMPPGKPNFKQTLYSFISGATNTADSEINQFNTKTERIQNEISELKKIRDDIEELIPIYAIGGGKRCNRKSKKSGNNRRSGKSNCRR